MAQNQYRNKFIINGEVKLDLSNDTITADKLAAGITAHDRSGAPITGENTYDADTSDANAVASEILSPKTAYVNGVKVTGTMPNRGAVEGEISDKDTPYTIPAGYHDGSGTVGIDETNLAKLIPENIKQDIEILGVTGTHSGSEDVTLQSKSTTPTFAQQTIIADAGYTGLSQVVVAAIPVTETDNPAGGITVTIG